MKETTHEIVNKLQNLTVKDDEVEEEYKKVFGSGLHFEERTLLIQEIGNQLHCSIIAIAKAQVLFHQYQRLKKYTLNTLWLAAACLNLGRKLCEEDVNIYELILKFYHVEQDLKNIPDPSRPDPPSQKLLHMRETLYKVEYFIFNAMAYNIDCRIAHTYVYKFLAQLQSFSDASEGMMVSMSSTATKLLSTYYLCERSIDFNADEIAMACLQFAFLYCGIIDSSIKDFMNRELRCIQDKIRISDILDELIIVSDVSTKLRHI